MKYYIVIRDEDDDEVNLKDRRTDKVFFIMDTVASNPNEALSNVIKDIPFPEDTTGRAFVIEIIPEESKSYNVINFMSKSPTNKFDRSD